MPPLPTQHRSHFTTLAVIAACLWLPFAWLLIPAAVDSPWSHTHLQWIALWPILPGFVPGYALRGGSGWAPLVGMGLFTLIVLVGLCWFGTRGWRQLLLAAGAALLIAVPTSCVTYLAFRR